MIAWRFASFCLISTWSGPRIIFTSGATDAINLVAESWGSANLTPDDEVLITAPRRCLCCSLSSCFFLWYYFHPVISEILTWKFSEWRNLKWIYSNLHSSSHVEVMEHHSNIVPWQYLGCTGVMAIWMSWNTKRISSKAGNTKNWSETEVGWHHWRGAGRIGREHLWMSNLYRSVTQYIPVCKRIAALWHDLEAQKWCRESWTWRSSSDFWLPRRNSWPLFTSPTHWVASIRSLGTSLHIAPINGRRMICYAPMKNTSKCMSLLSL